MWAVEGLTHRYPTKVLAELIPTCPQYCGHCTRMDLVGNDTENFLKYKFEMKQYDRWDAMIDYLKRTPVVRDVVVSGGDMANVPTEVVQRFGSELGLLLEAPVVDIAGAWPLLGEAIDRMRQGRVLRQPGYDGEYGVIRLFADGELERLS